jgi:hypothetical protein
MHNHRQTFNECGQAMLLHSRNTNKIELNFVTSFCSVNWQGREQCCHNSGNKITLPTEASGNRELRQSLVSHVLSGLPLQTNRLCDFEYACAAVNEFQAPQRRVFSLYGSSLTFKFMLVLRHVVYRKMINEQKKNGGRCALTGSLGGPRQYGAWI